MLSDMCILSKKTFMTKKQSALNRIFREMFQCSSVCICPEDLFGIDTIRGQQPGALRQLVERWKFKHSKVHNVVVGRNLMEGTAPR